MENAYGLYPDEVHRVQLATYQAKTKFKTIYKAPDIAKRTEAFPKPRMEQVSKPGRVEVSRLIRLQQVIKCGSDERGQTGF